MTLALTGRPYYSRDDELCGHEACVNEGCTFYEHDYDEDGSFLHCPHEECTGFINTSLPTEEL